MPRLDVPFKKSIVPKNRGGIPDLRVHWLKFVKCLRDSYIRKGMNPRILELPLWQITPEFVSKQSETAELIYIPHKMRENWLLDKRVLYYMQMVIPNIFSIDSKGWCASSSQWPIQSTPVQDTSIFDKLRSRIDTNCSKFIQPSSNSESLDCLNPFIFFPCQIPHDETIQFHSDVSVESALEALISGLKQSERQFNLVIKGHPANKLAMKSLYNIYKKYKQDASIQDQLIWVDNISIHQLLSNSIAVYTVNSGVGLEALLHLKKVFIFGNADYQSVANKITFGGNLSHASLAVKATLDLITNDQFDPELIALYKSFISNWYCEHYDYENLTTFEKIPTSVTS